ncbi:MAG TPA: hypothetical protein VN776_13975 [Terracidiphilus sp.]|nr:hypothetical protein [Terracidiphilus sp.]
MLVVLACVTIGSLAFVAHERGAVKQMSAQNAAMSTALDQTRSQLQDVITRLNQLSEAQQTARVSSPHRGTTRVVRRDDPRWKQVQGQLAEHRKAIDSTQSDLTGAKTELSGSIARTHEEVVALARKGERNYYEFDLKKSKQFQREGPISVSLRKANTRHVYADLELRVDDAQLTKKHVNMFEPVMLYASESKQPVELVINQVSKDRIHGYISTAKYKASDLPALSSLTDSSADNPGGAAAVANSSPSTPQLRNRAQR